MTSKGRNPFAKLFSGRDKKDKDKPVSSTELSDIKTDSTSLSTQETAEEDRLEQEAMEKLRLQNEREQKLKDDREASQKTKKFVDDAKKTKTVEPTLKELEEILKKENIEQIFKAATSAFQDFRDAYYPDRRLTMAKGLPQQLVDTFDQIELVETIIQNTPGSQAKLKVLQSLSEKLAELKTIAIKVQSYLQTQGCATEANTLQPIITANKDESPTDESTPRYD